MKYISLIVLALWSVIGCSKKHSDNVSGTPSPTPEIQKEEYGLLVQGKPGFVQSPYAPEKGYVDVRGFPKNTEVKDPYTGKIFLVPEGMTDVPAPTPKPLPNQY